MSKGKDNTIKAEVMTKNVVKAFRMLKNVRHNGKDYYAGNVYQSIPGVFLEDDFAKEVEVKEDAEFATPTDRSDIISAEIKARKEAKKERQNVVQKEAEEGDDE